MLTRLIAFLILNFGALGLGGMFTGKGVPSEWYQNLNKAPWTPPGWAFGTAWTTIMICFSIYLAYLWPLTENKKELIGLFALQWLLNVAWNPVFFHFNAVGPALVIIVGLTILIGFLILHYHPLMKTASAWLMPYFIWLLIACSLNAYILFNNG